MKKKKEGYDFKCPAGCCAEVEEYMDKVVQFLREKGKLSPVDSASLYMLARQLDVFVNATTAANVEGLMVISGKSLVPNPKIELANRAETMIIKILKEFGLTPASRKLLGVKDKESNSVLAELMGK